MKGRLTANDALWMLAQLDPDTQRKVRRRLALRLAPPVSSAVGRVRELGFAAQLLRPLEPRPGWSFAYVPRRQYDELRPPTSPSSASLVTRYGSWAEACLRTYNLLPDGSYRPGFAGAGDVRASIRASRQQG